MKFKNVLITGGAGFVGSNLALKFKKLYPHVNILCLDNLKRRGSELNISRLKDAGISFIHGDIRNKEDFQIPNIDLVIECSAEPSVMAGINSTPDYVINTNLLGTLNCLEFARVHNATFFFISTSRVYPYNVINQSNYLINDSRFDFSNDQSVPGLSTNGIAENFPLNGPRTLYGATKLSSEYFIEEYMETYNLQAIINRFGCIAGPWQMGKVDQGVMALWVSRHIYGKNLKYIGFGGEGRQVRDFIHIDDVFEIINIQLNDLEKSVGNIFNVGGGYENSVSLRELTKLCQKYTKNTVKIDSDPIDRSADIKVYITDNKKISSTFNWKPNKSVDKIVEDTTKWINENKEMLKNILE